MSNAAWSTETDADVSAVLEAMAVAMVPPLDTVPGVYVNRAPYRLASDGTKIGEPGPYLVAWPLLPENLGRGLAGERAGVNHQQWQVTVTGRVPMEARVMAETVYGFVWPTWWEHVETGPWFEDTTAQPSVWSVPLTFVHRGTG